jgi:radical SAM superfamily enzyme YgiQ (UPF0313 family)
MSSKFKALIFVLGNGGKDYVQGRVAGPYRIATELRSQGWDIEVIDFFYQWTLEELQQLMRSRVDKDVKFVGFGHLFTHWPELAEDFCKWIKETYPDLIIIYGSVMYQDLKSKYIDYYVKGFAEVSILKLLEFLFSNGQRPIMTPIDSNKVILSEQYYSAAPWRNPIIIYEDRDFIQPFEWGSTEFSRGCKFSCAFCNFPILGVKGDYTRDADNFELQMRDAYDRFGMTKYLVSDETFNDSTEKITKFADVVERLPFTPFYSGFLRADLLISRPHEREELLRMNFLSQFYGIESFNHGSAKAIGKGMHPEKIKQGLVDIKNYFKSHGNKRYRGFMSLIAGLPADTEESIWQAYDWIKENWQGESFMFLPLDISEISPVNNSSKMSLNYAKYGYKEMLQEDIDKELANHPSFYRQANLRGSSLYWENEHTNYFKMDRITRFIKEDTYEQNFSIPSFTLSSDITGDDIDTTLAKSVRVYFDDETKAFIANYKQKKLSL